MPEGDTIAWHANRLRPVLEGAIPDEIRPHARLGGDRWSERLAGQRIKRVDTRGKHLLLRFDHGLVVHSHLGMVGSWGVFPPGRRWSRSPRRAWLTLRVGDVEVVQFDGSTLELITEGRSRLDQRLSALGPDVLAERFDGPEFLRRLRLDDTTRPFGDALLDQRIVAGIGNMWKAEGCWEARIDPWRCTASVGDTEALAVIDSTRPRMKCSARRGPMAIDRRVYGRAGQPCRRCGAAIRSRGQWEDNRTTYWCPGCQR
ncbi:MAG TPA: DNA-formamidopyrimidine glycosylase family protein [Solirubrobacteraceae bacterium]|nr:DNA-formamidopyrimidine glycosylase family protein [Solirubrobacteraceae bacterium]